jgi:hypothetical protein
MSREIFCRPDARPPAPHPMAQMANLQPGGLCPPDPLGFSAFLLSQVIRFRTAEDEKSRPQPGPAPESALGLLPSRALSSARSLLVYSKGTKLCKTKLLTKGSALIHGFVPHFANATGKRPPAIHENREPLKIGQWTNDNSSARPKKRRPAKGHSR